MHTYYLIKRKEKEKKINVNLEKMVVYDTTPLSRVLIPRTSL